MSDENTNDTGVLPVSEPQVAPEATPEVPADVPAEVPAGDMAV
jgi:hypothetical protein